MSADQGKLSDGSHLPEARSMAQHGFTSKLPQVTNYVMS